MSKEDFVREYDRQHGGRIAGDDRPKPDPLVRKAIDAWHAIASDLAAAAREAGESRIHVDDLADAIRCYCEMGPGWPKWNTPEGARAQQAIRRAIREFIAGPRGQYVRL